VGKSPPLLCGLVNGAVNEIISPFFPFPVETVFLIPQLQEPEVSNLQRWRLIRMWRKKKIFFFFSPFFRLV